MPSPEDFSALLVTEGLPKLYADAMELADIYAADGYAAQSALLKRAIDALFAELRRIATEVALYAREAIREAEIDSRVRPDTEGGGGPRLSDYIGASEALVNLPGSVGVNDEELLRHSPVHWWWTNEEGYSGFMGREIVGYFFGPGGGGAGFMPSSAMAGQHPIFKPYSSGFSGVIDQPIPERRFVEHGFERAEAEWHARVQRAKQAFREEFVRIDGQTRAVLP